MTDPVRLSSPAAATARSVGAAGTPPSAASDAHRPLRRLVLTLATIVPLAACVQAAEPARSAPPPAANLGASAAGGLQTAVLAGGCFWGVQGVFQHVAGVKSAVSGYAGGTAATATYSQIGNGRTGHAEAVRIVYDPATISYGRLLQIFFSVAHDPTQRNRQGPDIGTQYRSTIFPQDADQARIASRYIEQLDRANTYGRPLATTVEPLKPFYPAEAYHQDFMTLNPRHPYIAAHDLPKVAQLERMFPEVYRARPVLVGAGKVS